jgi:hypothetical protein
MGEGGGRRGMSTFLYLGSSQIINDTPPPNKTKKKNNPFNAKISFEAYLHIPVYKDEEEHYES